MLANASRKASTVLEGDGKHVLACRWMPEEPQPPRLVVPIALALSAGTLACIAAFITHRFLFLFFTAGSLWILFLLYLYRRWFPGVPFVPGRRKSYRAIAVLVGFLIFEGAWYIIVRLDSSLR
jgi:hypothetical protein